MEALAVACGGAGLIYFAWLLLAPTAPAVPLDGVWYSPDDPEITARQHLVLAVLCSVIGVVQGVYNATRLKVRPIARISALSAAAVLGAVLVYVITTVPPLAVTPAFDPAGELPIGPLHVVAPGVLAFWPLFATLIPAGWVFGLDTYQSFRSPT